MNHVSHALKESTKVVSPAWPLYSFVGVNPFWNLKESNFYETLSKLSCINGENLFLPLNYYTERYNKGLILDRDIKKSIDLLNDFNVKFDRDIQSFIRESLEEKEHSLNFETYCEFLAKAESSMAKDTVIDEISKYCASYFDQGQAPFSLKNNSKRLYSEWKDLIAHDATLHHLGYKKQSHNIVTLRDKPEDMISECANILNIKTHAHLQNYLMKICKHIMGWSSHIQYQLWQADFGLNKNHKGTNLEDVIAIFMAYECFLKTSRPQFDKSWQSHLSQQEVLFSNKDIDHIFKLLCIWQRSLELSYQRNLIKNITANVFSINDNLQKECQMIFCIDVRSEVIRRKIEHVLPQVSTHGFAGFFGVSLECNQSINEQATYRCPVLLQPKININECVEHSYAKKALGLKSLEKFMSGLKQGLASSFAYVELFGILSGFKIISRCKSHKNNYNHILKNKFFKPSTLNENLDLKTKVEIANFALTHIGIKEFSKIVIICGHGSVTTNNAFASSLDCGACGGHSGDLNARFLCNILNNIEVRNKISKDSKFILPKETKFIPALHETVSDEIHILEEACIEAKDKDFMINLKSSLQNAAQLAQQERASILGNSFSCAAERSTNWSEVRPEWALVNNACFIVAPRARSKNINLEGRAFLHDYDYTRDEDMKTLELIMTAPMIVTNWINMQYYASAVERNTFGSGNKMIQNIVGLFGVLEGNSGDLKIGLPFQSVHDGAQLIHEPLRLTVVIEAPQVEIEKIIEKHHHVKCLIENQWLHIFRIERDTQNVFYRRSKDNYIMSLV